MASHQKISTNKRLKNEILQFSTIGICTVLVEHTYHPLRQFFPHICHEMVLPFLELPVGDTKQKENERKMSEGDAGEGGEWK